MIRIYCIFEFVLQLAVTEPEKNRSQDIRSTGLS